MTKTSYLINYYFMLYYYIQKMKLFNSIYKVKRMQKK